MNRYAWKYQIRVKNSFQLLHEDLIGKKKNNNSLFKHIFYFCRREATEILKRSQLRSSEVRRWYRTDSRVVRSGKNKQVIAKIFDSETSRHASFIRFQIANYLDIIELSKNKK